MIANKIMKLDDGKKYIMYRASCACTDPNCDMVLDMEVDCDDLLVLNLYKDLVWSSHWYANNWFKQIYLRIKCAIRILFVGRIEVEDSFIMYENQMDDFISALTQAKEKMKNGQQSSNS